MEINISLNRAAVPSQSASYERLVAELEADERDKRAAEQEQVTPSFASIFSGIFGEMFKARPVTRPVITRDEDGDMTGIEYMDTDGDGAVQSVSTSYQFKPRETEGPHRSKTVNKYGPLELTTRLEDTDKYSVIWFNRMNNASIGLHKFSRGSFIVEMSVAGGVSLGVLNFKAIEPALVFSLLNTDVKGVQEEHAALARRQFRQFISDREPRAVGAVKFTKTAWQVNLLRGEEVQFTEGGEDKKGRLMFLMPTNKAIVVTYDERGKPVKHTVPFESLWM